MNDAAQPFVEDRAAALRAWLTTPVDGIGLIAFRVAFGLLMVGQSLKFMRRADANWLEPRLLFPYEGFEWVRPWPGVGLAVHCAVMALVALCVATGVRARACSALLGLLFAYTVLLDQTHYNNHYYLIVLLSGLLAALGTGATSPRWHVLLVQAQLLIVYTFAGVAKLNADWLAGEPMRHWLGERAAGSVLEPLLRAPWLPVAISWAGALFDLSIAPLLVWRRTRPVALVAAAGFHLTNAFLFDIGVFPWLMLGSLALFLPPETVRRLARAPRDVAGEPVITSRRETLHLALAGLYLLVQLALPLRHWLYPGDVAWSEEGHRFAWRMKLRDKVVDLSLRARDARGREWDVDLTRWVTPKQRDEATLRPQLIWQLARRVREDLEAERRERVEVFAHARGTLNFRAHAQDLIDPRVDLSRAPYGAFQAAPWIVALAQ